MEQKNTEKYGEILKYAYCLFSQNAYSSVFLKDIAEHVGISKSRLQNLYPKKSEIMRELLSEYLFHSFQYVEKWLPADLNLYYKLSLFTTLFWKTIDSNKRLNKFMMNILTDYELRSLLIDCVFQWHQEMKYNGDDISMNVSLKPALIFSISGGLELYVQKDILNVETQYIMHHVTESFMRMLGCDVEQINDVLKSTEEWLSMVDVNLFLEYCNNNIAWIRS